MSSSTCSVRITVRVLSGGGGTRTDNDGFAGPIRYGSAEAHVVVRNRTRTRFEILRDSRKKNSIDKNMASAPVEKAKEEVKKNKEVRGGSRSFCDALFHQKE